MEDRYTLEQHIAGGIYIPHCHASTNYPFSITTTAGYYSQLAGVLAGFAFTALIFLATARITREDSRDAFASALRVLVAGFLALILTSLGYAVLAGEPGTDGRTASDEPLLGVGFAIAGTLVVYAIVLTLDAADQLVPWPSAALQQVGASTRHAIAVGVAPLLILYIYLGVQDYEVIRYCPGHGVEPLDVMGWSLIGLQIVVSWLAYPILLKYRTQAASQKTVDLYAKWLSRVLLVTTFICAASFVLVDTELSPDATLPAAVPATCLVAMFFASSGIVWVVACSRPITSNPDSHATSGFSPNANGPTRWGFLLGKTARLMLRKYVRAPHKQKDPAIPS
jgi:hypothetical protein